ncbi:hypothetical protein [Sphingopyxis sp.]|uniref:hypothetical protein n=1 Tax=Sphingopyxis sp. TaxID=1908224 RepID=UPI002ED8CC30
MLETGKLLPAITTRKRTRAVIPMAIAVAIAVATPSDAGSQTGSITLYCGGGATGDGGGLIAQADGALLHVGRERPGEPHILKRTTIPLEQVRRWHAMLDTARFDSMPRGEPSNMTCSLSRRSPRREHLIFWGGNRQLPKALRAIVEEMWAAGRND